MIGFGGCQNWQSTFSVLVNKKEAWSQAVVKATSILLRKWLQMTWKGQQQSEACRLSRIHYAVGYFEGPSKISLKWIQNTLSLQVKCKTQVASLLMLFLCKRIEISLSRNLCVCASLVVHDATQLTNHNGSNDFLSSCCSAKGIRVRPVSALFWLSMNMLVNDVFGAQNAGFLKLGRMLQKGQLCDFHLNVRMPYSMKTQRLL